MTVLSLILTEPLERHSQRDKSVECCSQQEPSQYAAIDGERRNKDYGTHRKGNS